MTKKKRPAVDDAEVNKIVDAVRKHSDFARTTPEDRAEVAYKLALGYAMVSGTTSAWAKELASKVRQRVLWAKPSN